MATHVPKRDASKYTFARLAPEIRQMIFEAHFRSIIVRRGFGRLDSRHTALLQTCSAICKEAEPLMACNITLYFYSAHAMNHYLLPMTREFLSQLRYIRIKGYPCSMDYHSLGMYTMTTTALRPFFHSLQLGRPVVKKSQLSSHHWICVRDPLNKLSAFADISSLLGSNGWEELHFVTPGAGLLSRTSSAYQQLIQQPREWDTIIRTRDDKDSGAEAGIYIAMGGVAGMEEDARTRKSYDHLGSAGSDVIPTNGALVVAKRGRDSPDVEDSLSVFTPFENYLDP